MPMEGDLTRTKIVCTIGPASSTGPVLQQMMQAGMDVARINFSHSSHEANLELIESIRKAAAANGRPIAILQDLQGPKLRVGVLPGEGLELMEGSTAILQAGVLEAEQGVIPIPYERMASDLSKGDRILLADGTRELEVIGVSGNKITTKVLLGGRIISHKGINVPTVTLSIETLTEKDEQDLAFGLQQNIDFVALSFVRTPEDVTHLRKKIEQYLPDGVEPPHIIVKIEKHEALENFDAILEQADGVMIARGDLGIETPVAQLPVRQKALIAKCVVAGKPVITATEMLASMEHNPRPTRAEVSDVANAVIDHTDAVMLSGESAMGRYPIRAVQMMADVIRNTEESPLDDVIAKQEGSGQPISLAMGAAAIELARKIGATSFLITTQSGYTARAVSRLRPKIPMYAATPSKRTQQQLLLSWGIQPLLMEKSTTPEDMVKEALEQLQKNDQIKKGDLVVVLSGLARPSGGYQSALRVIEV